MGRGEYPVAPWQLTCAKATTLPPHLSPWVLQQPFRKEFAQSPIWLSTPANRQHFFPKGDHLPYANFYYTVSQLHIPPFQSRFVQGGLQQANNTIGIYN